MPRRVRINLPGVSQHIVQRGNNRQTTFATRRDYGCHLECVRDAADKYGCDLHANHPEYDQDATEEALCQGQARNRLLLRAQWLNAQARHPQPR